MPLRNKHHHLARAFCGFHQQTAHLPGLLQSELHDTPRMRTRTNEIVQTNFPPDRFGARSIDIPPAPHISSLSAASKVSPSCLALRFSFIDNGIPWLTEPN